MTRAATSGRPVYLSERCIKLRNVPPEEREPCPDRCFMLIVEITEGRRVWRCETCLRYAVYENAPAAQGELFA